MLSSAASRFDSMQAQPPTPPKDVSKAVDDAISFLDDSHEIERSLSKTLVQRRPSLQAAAPSPAPSHESAATSNSKKVGFSPHAVYHHLPGQDRFDSPARRVRKRSPSSKQLPPLKSILKCKHAPPLTPDDLDSKLSYFSPDVPGSFAKMLQSILTQLASQEVSSRLDAYKTLNGTLQAYSDVPDPTALAQKLGQISQFLARDVAWKDGDGKLNTNIVMQALKLTNFLLFNDKISAAFDDDFRCFLVDRSIAVMDSSDMPKQIMKAHVHLLAQPKLLSPALSASRADKVLDALQTIEQRCTGNSIISARLVIYQRLLEQTPALMLTRMRDWLEQTFHCVLSSINDIRNCAIDTCTKGGFRLGIQSTAAKGVSDFLETEIEEGPTYYDYFSTRLLETLSEKELAPCVPRIWSAVILYFRSRKSPLERWSRFRHWLSIMQKCLNSSDIHVRYEATLAWNKLVYTVFELSPSQSVMSMLKLPIISGIDKRGSDTFSKQIRQYSVDCYCNLLHYGLRPSLSPDEVSSGWQLFVEPVLLPMMQASSKGRTTACRILSGLLSGNGGVWNANAALVPTAIKPDNLPRLEPRWIRANLASVMKIIEPAVKAGLWTSPELNLGMDSAWAAIAQTIADAGAQEVRTSADLKQAIATMTGFFRRLWKDHSKRPAEADVQCWLSNYIALLTTAVAKIGASHFVDDFLATSDSGVVEVAPTPSTKRSKHFGAPQSPMVIMLLPFFKAGGIAIDEASGPQKIGDLLYHFSSSRPTPAAEVELLSRAFNALRVAVSGPNDEVSARLLWSTIARSTTAVMRSPSFRNQQQANGTLGSCLKHAVEIFSEGLASSLDSELHPPTLALYDAIYDLAREQAGEGGVVVGVMEPIAKSILAASTVLSLRSKLQLADHMVSKAVWPKNRQALESARKSMWGPGLVPLKSNLFDPFDKVYALLVDCMSSMYVAFDEGHGGNLSLGIRLSQDAVRFLETAPLSLSVTALRRTQAGFAAWIRDDERKTACHIDVSQMITSMWTALLKIMMDIPSSDSDVLKSLETLLVAGLTSPRRQIVNETILFWNAKFGPQEKLEYPANLESVLRARLLETTIELPTLPESNIDHVPATLPEFYAPESQNLAAPSPRSPAHTLLAKTISNAPTKEQRAQSEYLTAQKSPASKSNVVPGTIDRRSAASGSSTPKSRLRHDDSQIRFAPIDSSPIRFDDSQHLTEHQKEVMARQNEAAQMFPELSSSPMAQSTALPRALPKRLDFAFDARDGDAGEVSTPTGLPDAAGLMSDDLPSSPTPSSTKDMSHSGLDLEDDKDTEDESDEPPSSPPRGSDAIEGITNPQMAAQQRDAPDGTTVDITDFGIQDDVGAIQARGEGNQSTSQQEDDANFPSDSNLPTEQLQLEAEAADAVGRSAEEDDDTPHAAVLEALPAATIHDVSRVEDSFVAESLGESTTNDESPNQRRSGRKRKRPSEETFSAKKQKSASPFKRFISRIWQGSPEEDEDVGEEIVVASSQRSQSPVSPPQPDSAGIESHHEPLSQPMEDLEDEVGQIKEEVMAPPPKRRPGRPRKSATPTPSLSQDTEHGSQTRPLKRRASVLSNASHANTEASDSFVKDTPASSKTRRGRKSQSASQGSRASSPQSGSQTDRRTRRTATAVMISPPKADAVVQEEQEARQTVENPAKERTARHNADTAAPGAERPKLTPKSILGRLKDALSDFVGMKINPTEMREFDDVLFEFRQEVHEAGRANRRQ